MRKIGFGMAALSVLAGIGGFFLRRTELATVFDAQTGLAARNAPVSIALIALSAIVVLLLFGLSFLVPERKGINFAAAFGGSLPLCVPLSFFALVICAAAGWDLFVSLLAESVRGFSIAWASAALLSGCCLLVLALGGTRGKQVAIPAVVPVFWLCLWHIISHIEHAANPTLLSYVYLFFALVFLLLSLYYIASFAFFQARVRRFLFCGASAVYFTGVALAGGQTFSQNVILLALAATVLLYMLLLTNNRSRPAQTAYWPDNLTGDLPDKEEGAHD